MTPAKKQAIINLIKPALSHSNNEIRLRAHGLLVEIDENYHGFDKVWESIFGENNAV